MCPTCQSLYNDYEQLKRTLSNACSEVENCKASTEHVSLDFSSVIIEKKPIDDGVISDIKSALGTITGNLNVLVGECSSKMSNISSSCPGADHYKKKSTILTDEI